MSETPQVKAIDDQHTDRQQKTGAYRKLAKDLESALSDAKAENERLSKGVTAMLGWANNHCPLELWAEADQQVFKVAAAALTGGTGR